MFGFRIAVFVRACALSILLAAPSTLFAAVGAEEATPLASELGDRPVLLLPLPGCVLISSRRLPLTAHYRRWLIS